MSCALPGRRRTLHWNRPCLSHGLEEKCNHTLVSLWLLHCWNYIRSLQSRKSTGTVQLRVALAAAGGEEVPFRRSCASRREKQVQQLMPASWQCTDHWIDVQQCPVLIFAVRPYSRLRIQVPHSVSHSACSSILITTDIYISMTREGCFHRRSHCSHTSLGHSNLTPVSHSSPPKKAEQCTYIEINV